MEERGMAGNLPQSIESKLDGFRRSVRMWVLVDGLSLIGVLLVGLTFLSLFVDRFMRMDRAQRVVSFGLGAAAMAFLAYRRLVYPLSRELKEDALCQRVEAQHGELHEKLIAAVQFSRMGNKHHTGYSSALVQASIDQGVAAADQVNFGDVLDSKKRNKSFLTAGSLLAVLALTFILFPGVMSLWFSRNVLMSNETWPQETYLKIQGLRNGVLAVPRGDDFLLKVEADAEHVIPNLVYVDFDMEDDGGSGTEQLVMIGKSNFHWTLKNVQKPLRLRVRGGDAETQYIEVHLVARPTVEDMSLHLTPPAYTGQKPRMLPAGEGSYNVLRGSTLVLKGKANKSLEKAGLYLGKTQVADLLQKGSKSFETTIEIKTVGRSAYRILLKDTDGLDSRRPTRFTLRARPDRKPSVRAQLVGIGEMITTKASVPVQFKIKDDFAVLEAGLACKHLTEGESTEKEINFPFNKESGLKEKWGHPEIEYSYRLEVEPLGLPVNSHLNFQVEAKDNDTLNGPNRGVSGMFSLKIVTEDELRTELLRREQEQRQEFERLLKDQKALFGGVKGLRKTLGGAGKSDAKAWHVLKKYEKRQRLAGARSMSIATQFAQILAEVENNKLEEAAGKVRKRLRNGIVLPLQRLAQGPIPKAANALDQAGTASIDVKARRQALDVALEQQERILKDMNKILRNMVKWEGYQEAVNLLRLILKNQKDINERTIKAQQKKILNIFDDDENDKKKK